MDKYRLTVEKKSLDTGKLDIEIVEVEASREPQVGEGSRDLLHETVNIAVVKLPGGAVDFLKEKKILSKDSTQWVVTFEDGRKVNIIDLMEEYASGTAELLDDVEISERIRGGNQLDK